MIKADAKLIEQAENFTTPPAYCVRADTALTLAAKYAKSPLELFSLAYSMGYIKGQRAAENEARRAAK